jgi:hypothetical protein
MIMSTITMPLFSSGADYAVQTGALEGLTASDVREWNAMHDRVYPIGMRRACAPTGRFLAGGTYADDRTAEQLEWDTIANRAIAGY